MAQHEPEETGRSQGGEAPGADQHPYGGRGGYGRTPGQVEREDERRTQPPSPPGAGRGPTGAPNPEGPSNGTKDRVASGSRGR